MKIQTTLAEILRNCNDWDQFCEDKGTNEWVVREGFGDNEITLDEAYKYGLIKNNRND